MSGTKIRMEKREEKREEREKKLDASTNSKQHLVILPPRLLAPSAHKQFLASKWFWYLVDRILRTKRGRCWFETNTTFGYLLEALDTLDAARITDIINDQSSMIMSRGYFNPGLGQLHSFLPYDCGLSLSITVSHPTYPDIYILRPFFSPVCLSPRRSIVFYQRVIASTIKKKNLFAAISHNNVP